LQNGNLQKVSPPHCNNASRWQGFYYEIAG
jgi:hypothetical protein